MFVLRWSSYLFLIEEAMLDQTLRDMNNLRKFYNQHLNRVFLKTEPKQVVDYLDPAENGEAGEESHCASDQSKRSLRCHLGNSFFFARRGAVCP